jgi:hypothetical protein
MLQRAVTCVMLAAALAIFATTAKAQEAGAKSHEGTVVSAAEGKLVMTDKTGANEHTHMIGADAKITCDGKACKLTDLKKGDKVKVTTGEGGKVVSVEATRAGGLKP